MRRILVTGGTGTLGSRVVSHLPPGSVKILSRKNGRRSESEFVEATEQKKIVVSVPLPLRRVRPLVKKLLVLPTAQNIGRSWKDWVANTKIENNPYLMRTVVK